MPQIRIEGALQGWSSLEYYGSNGQFTNSIAIDPDFPIDDTVIRTSGMLRPTAMSKFSSTEITGVPFWMISNPKDSNTYVYANDGKVHVVNSSVAMGTALNSGSALSSSTGNGAEYYDNYIYLAKNADVARYGPLNGSPSLTQDYWTSGLSKTALVNTTYPSIRGIALPNHVMHRHTDNKLYFADVVGNQGVLHYIKTSKSSAEGDTNDGSTYNALDFGYGQWPTAIESYGTDLAVALIEGSNTTVRQKPAKVSFWDTTSSSYSKIIDVEFDDPFITALRNVNGVLYVWSGNGSGGHRLCRFVGGYSFEEIAYFEEGNPPFPGAVDHQLSRVLWGTYLTDPASAAVVMSYGSKSQKIPMGTQCPFKATSGGANGVVTSLKLLEQANNSKRRPIIGWSDDSAKGLDKITTTYTTAYYTTEWLRIGQPWRINKIRIPLAQAVVANMTIVPKIYTDYKAGTTYTLDTINSTNYPNSERNAVFDLANVGVRGQNNFKLELAWSGSALLTVGFPIVIEWEAEKD